MGLLDYPVLQIEQQSSQLEYAISDEEDRPIGRATQVAGPKPRKGLLSMFGSGLDDARIVVQVGGLDGVPLFFVDYQSGAPAAIVAPDGTVLGRFVYDFVGAAQQMAVGGMAQNIARAALGVPRVAMVHRLVDGADRPLCELDWTIERQGVGDNARWVPVGGTYTDMNGQQIAQLETRQATFKDRYSVRLFYQLPEPLRTLVVASPLAYDLSRS